MLYLTLFGGFMASLNLSLPEEMRQYLNAKASGGIYATPSEFVRDLIRRNMERDSTATLEADILRSLSDLEHGRYHPFDIEKIRKKAKAELRNE
jgi:antitoxin ParD1/3/4